MSALSFFRELGSHDEIGDHFKPCAGWYKLTEQSPLFWFYTALEWILHVVTSLVEDNVKEIIRTKKAD